MRKIPKPTGTSPLERCVARIIEQLEASQIIESPNVRPEHSSKGVALMVKPGGKSTTEGEVTINRYKIVAISSDRLTCNKFKNDTEFEDYPTDDPEIRLPFNYTVAMPFGLQPRGEYTSIISYYDKLSSVPQLKSALVTYGPSSGGLRKAEAIYDETKKWVWYESVYPSYKVGDTILGLSMYHTGIPSVSIVDLNVDGRCWQVDFQLTAICEGTSQRLTLVHRTDTVVP